MFGDIAIISNFDFKSVMSLYSVLRDECLMKNVCIEIGAASSVWQLCKPLVHASSSVCQSGGNNKPTREGFYAQGSLCLRSKFLGGDKNLTLSHMQLNPPSSQRLKQKLATRCMFYPEPSCPVLDLRTPTFLSSTMNLEVRASKTHHYQNSHCFHGKLDSIGCYVTETIDWLDSIAERIR